MNLSLKWLHDFTNTDGISTKEYCDRMTDTGSKVEGYEVLGEDIQNVVVAKVVSMERHPNSDHLWICQMDIGSEITQIVTGAQNVNVGDIVPAAIPVAHLPGDVTIKAGKLRGVESNGMLCSIAELNLTLHDMPEAIEDGILILGKEFEDKVGMDIKEALMLDDTVVEFEITSNRPDCLSVIGLARETAISFDKPLSIPAPVVKDANDGDKIDNYLSVKISDADLCYRYSAKVVKNVKIAPSPLWLRMRLRAAGVRPINNIVDITNYVMLEYGQPMHAFDYAMLEGSAINVRRAADGELFRSLDDKDHTLDSSMLVIADGKKACALAGVMGGANSEIKDTTSTVVFESACFNGPSVRVTAKKNGMRTESSSRFEKGLDPENCMGGLLRACELVQLLGAGDVVDGIIDVYPTKPETVVLPLDADKINRFLGVDLSYDYMKSVLERLECRVDGDKIYVPSFRADLTCMQDIAEEIIRIYGYNNIKSTCINAETTQGGRTPKQQFEVDCEYALYGMGFDQIQTFSFISPKFYDKIRLPEDSALRESVVISNPLGEDTSVMRTTALPSMLDVVARNINFSNDDVRLFEMASIYLPNEDKTVLPTEKKVITLGAYGKGEDFYTVKGVVENILAKAGIRNAKFVAVKDDAAYHPGRCAKIVSADGCELGIFGQLHPLTAQNYGIDIPVYAGVLNFDEIWDNADMVIDYKPLPKFPAVSRDFSFVCDEDLEVGTIEEVMARAAGKLCEGVALFDVFRGEKIGEGKKSVAFRVTLRASDRTLTVEEADKVSNKIIKDLSYKLGLNIRG
ncbi:MAG: phenylalanine--tRNA ligase subunit beta [Ruminococcaceae bacterium]|nr:phenylalanine--tRNA ligase subunit beta [Oscillospiraceae bacterium]